MKLKKHVSTLTAIAALGCIMAVTPAIADGHKKGGEKFKQADTNGDGMLSKAEMKVQQEKRLDKMFSEADVDNDGNLSKEELHAHREKKRAHKAQK
ncbi:MAG: Ca2+-binding EF-hand superfamily protein [Candidatus Endobugula sp.]|jgi:Ca2+-binding EF-hand superfamily protein